jgi:hypothetical protein
MGFLSAPSLGRYTLKLRRIELVGDIGKFSEPCFLVEAAQVRRTVDWMQNAPGVS